MAETSTDPTAKVNTAPAAATTEEDSVASLTKLFHETKVEDGGKKKSIWTMTKETFGMADGNHHESDDTTKSLEEGLAALHNLVSKQPTHVKWEFSVTPLKEFNATLDDLFLAFLRWSNKEETTEEPLYNIHKAFRRLENYATWMNDNAKDLHEPHTVESVTGTHDLWQMKITHDDRGRLLWWIDLGKMNFKAIKATDLSQSLRYFVWQTHLVMLDERAQANGMVFIEAMAKKGMWECFTMIPMEISAKLDRLTIGSMPVKMKAIYMFHAAKWVHIMQALVRPFLSQKMRQRLICTIDKDDPQAICDAEFGRNAIPHGFGGMEGGTLKDLIESKYIKSETFA